MASFKLSHPVVKSLQGRTFAAAAAAQPKVSPDSHSIKKLSNGMQVGVLASNSPISRIAVVAQAGSRFENGDNLGVSHFLRLSSRLRTENMSSLALTRTVQQLGSDVSILGTREYIYFKSNVNRDSVGSMVRILQEMTTKQAFKPWEVSDAQQDKDGMLLDLAIYQSRPHVRAVELLHSAAFRNTLGNSLYAPDHVVGKLTSDQVMHFTKTNFSAGRMALIGIGVDGAELESLASEFEPFASADAPVEKSSYYAGGEIRENTGGDITYVAVGCGGPSLTSKDLIVAEVLRHILGCGAHIKYSDGTTVPSLAKAAAAATNAAFHVSCLNATYTDNGLFGFTAVAHASQIEKVLQAAGKQFKALESATDADVARAKNQLKAELCMQFEHPDILLNWLGEQALNGGEAVMPDDIYKMVDAVTGSDAKRVAGAILSAKPSMAVTGNTSRVPYLDQLC